MNERNGIQTENRPDGRNGTDRDGNERNARSGGMREDRFGVENDDRGLSGRDFARDDDRGRSLGQRGGYEQRDFGGRGSERDAEYRGQFGPDRDFDRSSRSYGGQSDRDSRMESRGHDRGEGNYSVGEDRFGADRSMSSQPSYGRQDAMKSGKPPKNYTRSDERLREEVCDALANSGHDWSDVEVTVSNGEVTLTGTVSDRSEKLQAEHMADRVRGVNEVTNQLKIKRADSSASRTASPDSSSTKDGADNHASRRRSA